MEKMLLIVKRTAAKMLSSIGLYSLHRLKKVGALRDYGWFRSFDTKIPVDGKGRPLPWLTYPAIEFLLQKVKKNMSVFEYGCGSSTFWWASRVKKVVSVEHDNEWFENVKDNMPANVMLYHIELEYGGDYSRKAAEHGEDFDILVIDGRDRVNCARNALKALKKDGVIIWDNSDRESYSEGYDLLKSEGFKRLDFIGMGPASVEKWTTSIFYRDKNCFGI